MHILLIPSWYPHDRNSISGVFMREQAHALQKAGHQLGVVVCPSLDSKKRLLKVRRLADLKAKTMVVDDNGIPIYRTHQWGWFPGFMPWGNRRLVLKSGLQMFERYLEEVGKPDIIHAHNIINGGYLATCIKERWHIPFVLTEHSTRFLRNLIRAEESRIIHYTLRRAGRIMAVGNALAQALHTYEKECEIEVLGNIIKDSFFTLPKFPPATAPNFDFVLIASLVPKKGVDILLKAFALGFKDRAVHLKIGGDGPLRGTLEQLSRKLGIAEQINFLGKLSREEVRDVIQNSHTLISASYTETFGVTLIEAMACGKPVIATRSGGPELFVNESNGLLVPPGDPNALAQAMQKMIQTYDTYDSISIRDECVSKFGEANYIQRLNAIYHQTLSMTEA